MVTANIIGAGSLKDSGCSGEWNAVLASVFGKPCFLIPVERRDSATLLKIIEEWIKVRVSSFHN